MNGLTWCMGEAFVWAAYVCVRARVRVCLCVDVNGCLRG